MIVILHYCRYNNFGERWCILLDFRIGDLYSSARDYLYVTQVWPEQKQAYIGLIKSLIALKWADEAQRWLEYFCSIHTDYAHSSQVGNIAYFISHFPKFAFSNRSGVCTRAWTRWRRPTRRRTSRTTITKIRRDSWGGWTSVSRNAGWNPEITRLGFWVTATPPPTSRRQISWVSDSTLYSIRVCIITIQLSVTNKLTVSSNCLIYQIRKNWYIYAW